MDDKRLVSTVTLIIFLMLLGLACWFDIDFSISISSALENMSPPESTGDGEMDMVLGGLMGMAIGGGLIFVFAVSILTALTALICLGFSIRNTKVENKPVKIINIILSCCFAAAAALGIIAVILLRVL